MYLQKIQSIFDRKLLHICNPRLNKVIQKFKFDLFSESFQTSIHNFQRKNKFNIIVIDEYINSQNKCDISDFFIVCFDYIILLIQPTDFSLFLSLFEFNSESIIYCTSENVKKKIEQFGNQRIHFRFSEDNDHLLIEKLAPPFLTKFELDFSNINPKTIKDIKFTWDVIRKSVSFYMISIGFLNSKYDRIIHFYDYCESGVEDKEIKSDEFIELHLYNRGSSSSIYFAYLIEKEEICLMKMFLKTPEEDKLFQREHENYLSIKHTLHPRYFGTTKYLSYNCLFIEYLEGKTLDEIDFTKESTKDIMKIIFEILIILLYLHNHGFIYRDLKPNNLIVDENGTVYLIDFDRMIKKSSTNSNLNMTDNFMEGYIAQEILNGEAFTYKSDIYSLGKTFAIN
ncbi:mitogen-activated protein kinase kinase kinase [Tritrichomonas musculus]|uniref:non-specific serine/threonine protein kinase n=1 Tax=Tritrichomonas musculus TaxID=1915356 RepID=A0ABR2J1P9_9EUKA